MNLPVGWGSSRMWLWSQADIAESVGRGVDWRIEPQGPIPLWVLGTAAVALVALIAVLFLVRRRREPSPSLTSRRQIALVALRAAVLLVVVWMIGGWAIARFETELPDLVIIVDRSQSMTLPRNDSASSLADGMVQSRWEAAVELLGRRDAALLRELAKSYRLRVQLVAESTKAVTGDEEAIIAALRGATPDGQRSPLGEALASAINLQRGRSTAGIVMVTDGVVTNGTPLAESARIAAEMRLPVFAVATGSTEPPPQVEIAELIADTTAMVGDRVSIAARIRWAGTAGEPIRLRLIDQADNAELASERIAMGTGAGTESVELSFMAQEAGVRRLRVEADALAGEVAAEDNVGEVVVEIRDESFRVLLIEGGPSYEFRFLKHLLERATNQEGSRPLVELISVLQQGDPRYADQDRTARRLPPVDDETLDRLDLIILSDSDPAGLGTVLQNRIADLVTRDGVSLAIIAGPDHLPHALAGTPLERLLPLDPREVSPPTTDADRPLRWRITPLGRSMPNLRIGASARGWSAAPPIFWLAEAGRVRPGARVLIDTPDRTAAGGPAPIVVSQWVGNGQVWLQLTDESFRLRGADSEAELYERYWLQLVRSLARRTPMAGDEQALLTVLGERFPEDRPVPFRVQVGSGLLATSTGEVEIAVTDRQGQSVTVLATEEIGGGGRFRGMIDGLAPGAYRAVLTRPVGRGDPASDSFVVEADPVEMQRTTVDLTALSDVAAITGGAVVSIDEAADHLVSLIPEGRSMRIRPLPPVPIWNHPLVALLLFSLLIGEWLLRRRWGSI